MSGEYQVNVSVKANQVLNNGNGTYTLVLEGAPIKEEHAKMLEELFPNLLEKANILLNQEVLLASLATPGQIQSKDKYGNSPSPVPVEQTLPVEQTRYKNK